MKPRIYAKTNAFGNLRLSVRFCVCLGLTLSVLLFSACAELKKPVPEPFYSETAPPQKKEFRWSNGKLPKSFDPALAAAPPETDIVRAIYEGLTDTDPKNLETIPGVAVGWSASEDYKTWIFKLRRDAKWSNNESVTAHDFVRSWQRLAEMGDQTAHYKLLGNIVGMQKADDRKPLQSEREEDIDSFSKQPFNQNLPQIFGKTLKDTIPVKKAEKNAKASPNSSETEKKSSTETKPENNQKAVKQKEVAPQPQFGVEAMDNYTLKVTLIKPDKDFPALAANPIFSPIYGDGKNFEADKLSPNLITNGAFRIFSVGQDGVTLDRAEYYWNSRQVELERVRFVPIESAEKALEAYRAGEIDAVTNADFQPLALKLLTPYDDFQRTTHSALNFYEFNKNNAPFNDLRVRTALSMAIERERLTEDEMGGASRPALSFLPFEEDTKIKLTQDTEKAKTLLADAGFADGEDFPVIRLVINRNNMQQRIARSVAKMWKENLNIDTEIIVKETDNLADSKGSGDFDIIRRGVVLPTTDETANMMTILAP